MDWQDFDIVELRRYAAALWKPAAGLVVVAGATMVDRLALVHRLGNSAAGTLTSAAAVFGTWFALSVQHALTQPRRDRAAAARLADLRTASQQPNCFLLEITQIQWTTTAGQLVWAVDTANGGVGEYWLPNYPTVPAGAFLLVRLPNHRPPEVLRHLPPRAVQAAHRHEDTSTRREQARDARCLVARANAEDAAIRDLIREAERITREP